MTGKTIQDSGILQKEAIFREWILSTASEVCPSCIDNCCNTGKHSISFFESGVIDLFQDHSVPVYLSYQLDKGSVMRWVRSNEEGLIYIHDKVALQKPALIIHEALIPGRDGRMIQSDEFVFSLYADGLCPIYSDGKCVAHEDPRRSRVCSDYPFYIRTSMHPTTKKDALFIVLKSNCDGFNDDSVVKEMRERFNGRDYCIFVKRDF